MKNVIQCWWIVCVIVATAAQGSQNPLSIDSPRGGEVFIIGQTYRIQLGAKTRAKTVRVELSRDGGNTFESIGAIDNTVKDHSKRNTLSWAPSGVASSNCLIHISSDTSTLKSAPFSISDVTAD